MKASNKAMTCADKTTNFYGLTRENMIRYLMTQQYIRKLATIWTLTHKTLEYSHSNYTQNWQHRQLNRVLVLYGDNVYKIRM